MVEELRELHRTVTRSVVEQEGDGVAEDLPEQHASLVPGILRPPPLLMEYRSVS